MKIVLSKDDIARFIGEGLAREGFEAHHMDLDSYFIAASTAETMATAGLHVEVTRTAAPADALARDIETLKEWAGSLETRLGSVTEQVSGMEDGLNEAHQRIDLLSQAQVRVPERYGPPVPTIDLNDRTRSLQVKHAEAQVHNRPGKKGKEARQPEKPQRRQVDPAVSPRVREMQRQIEEEESFVKDPRAANPVRRQRPLMPHESTDFPADES